MRRWTRRLPAILPVLGLVLCAGLSWLGSAWAAPAAVRYVDEGADWAGKRALFYDIDQGSQLIPLAWLEALKQADGKPFLEGSLARYGYLPTDDPANSKNLPIGFTRMPSATGAVVGIGCAACHTREITVKGTTWRIDGGPSMADFTPFALDLDSAVARVRNDPATFTDFAAAVLGPRAKDANAVTILRAEVDLWWVRYHTFIARSLPKDRPWGPARMDAISLIYNRLTGLDLGPPPTFLIPQNIAKGNAPVRYPFLWNSERQDITQWTGFAANGNAFYGLTRNLGEEYGVFGTFHPQVTSATFTILDRNYIADNSANLPGLKIAESLLYSMAPPKWPWPVDQALAKQGEEVFNRAPENGGCATCHGMREGQKRTNAPAPTFATPVVDVGTDRVAWQVALRRIETGSLRGATIAGLVPPLGKWDTALSIVRAGVVGAIGDDEVARPQVEEQAAKIDDPAKRIGRIAFNTLGLAALRAEGAVKRQVGLGPPGAPPLIVNGYEARVLQGVWAAAPYLHNGSVPTLVELLKPSAERVKSFKVGPEYDPATVGLAAQQTRFDYTLKTTGCDDILSGDSNCGHDYGTYLKPDEKRALLEYLKTL